MPDIYTSPPQTFTVEGGVPTLVTLKAPWRGEIRQIRMDQIDGADASATFKLYTSKDAARIADGESDSEAMEPLTQGVGEITDGVQSKASGETFRRDGISWPYSNQGGDVSQRLYEIYMVIETSGVGETQFVFSMLVELPYVG